MSVFDWWGFTALNRVRKLHERERQTMAEKKEQRRREKEERRIGEIEQEIQLRKAEEAR